MGIKKSEDELAKIHMVDRNSNSGLTKLAYSDGVHDLNDEFKKRDEDNFRILRNENMKKDIAKAKFFKNINHENRAKEKEELMNLPKIVRKSGLTSLAYSNGVHKLNNEFKKRDAMEFEAIEDEESKKHLEQAKFFKKINDENKEDKKQMLNIPKVIKKSEDELAKIHMVDRNSNSGLTKLAYSDGVHDLNDEFKKRDEDNFRI